MAHHNFEIGDIVVLKNGTSPQQVLRVNGTKIMAEYVGSAYQQPWRPASDYRLVRAANSKLPQTQTLEEPKMKLFQVTAEPEVFGTLLASDSTGKMVLELKPSGAVRAFKPDELTEVRPYTVQTHKGDHFAVNKGSVAVGDVIALGNGGFVVITRLDTCAEVTTPLQGRKVMTEPLA